MNQFFETLQRRWDMGMRFCVGLDPDAEKLPPKYQHRWDGPANICLDTARLTLDLAQAYKINLKFFPGPTGMMNLAMVVGGIRQMTNTPIILDAKYTDIGKTLKGSVFEAFVTLGVDAVTVDGYPGGEALRPFLDCADKGIFVLCRTSNQGSDEFQSLEVRVKVDATTTFIRPLYEHLAHRVAENWNTNGNCGLVVGATYPEEMKRVREIVGDDMWLLGPGIGTQQGDLEATLTNGLNRRKSGLLINSSSGIMFAEDPRAAAEKLTKNINAILEAM